MKLSWLFNIAVFPFAVTVLSILGSSSQAQAAAFLGNVSGTWGEPEKPDPESVDYPINPIYSGVETNVFNWGDPTPFEGASSNQLFFAGSSFSMDDGSLFKVGDLTYRNGTVLLGTSVEYVPLNLSLSFDEGNDTKEFIAYEFKLENTPNLSEDPELNADSVSIVNDKAKHTFVHDGNAYTISLNGFSQDEGKTYLSKFRVREGEKTTAAIYGQINKVKFSKKRVPEPGLVIGLSAIGVCLLSQKKLRKLSKKN